MGGYLMLQHTLALAAFGGLALLGALAALVSWATQPTKVEIEYKKEG